MNAKRKLYSLLIIIWICGTLLSFTHFAWATPVYDHLRVESDYPTYSQSSTIRLNVVISGRTIVPGFDYNYSLQIFRIDNSTPLYSFPNATGSYGPNQAFYINDTYEVKVSELGLVITETPIALSANLSYIDGEGTFLDAYCTFNVSLKQLDLVNFSQNPISVVYGDVLEFTARAVVKQDQTPHYPGTVYFEFKNNSISLYTSEVSTGSDGTFHITYDSSEFRLYQSVSLRIYIATLPYNWIGVSKEIPIQIQKLNLTVYPDPPLVSLESDVSPTVLMNFSLRKPDSTLYSPLYPMFSINSSLSINSITNRSEGQYSINVSTPSLPNIYGITISTSNFHILMQHADAMSLEVGKKQVLIDATVLPLKWGQDLEFYLIFREVSSGRKLSLELLRSYIQLNALNIEVNYTVKSENATGYFLSIPRAYLESISGFRSFYTFNLTLNFLGNQTHQAFSIKYVDVPNQHNTSLNVDIVDANWGNVMIVYGNYRDVDRNEGIPSISVLYVELNNGTAWIPLIPQSFVNNNGSLTIYIEWNQIQSSESAIQSNSAYIRLCVPESIQYKADVSASFLIDLTNKLSFSILSRELVRNDSIVVLFQMVDFRTSGVYPGNLSQNFAVEFLKFNTWIQIPCQILFLSNQTYRLVIEWIDVLLSIPADVPFNLSYRIRFIGYQEYLGCYSEVLTFDYNHHVRIEIIQSLIKRENGITIEFLLYDITASKYISINPSMSFGIAHENIEYYPTMQRSRNGFVTRLTLPWSEVKYQRFIFNYVSIQATLTLNQTNYIFPAEFRFPIYIFHTLNFSVKISALGKETLFLFPMANSTENQQNYWQYFNYTLLFPETGFSLVPSDDLKRQALVLDYDALWNNSCAFRENGSVYLYVYANSTIPSFSSIMYIIDVKSSEIEKMRTSLDLAIYGISVVSGMAGGVVGGFFVYKFAGKQYRKYRKSISAEELFGLE